MKPQSPSTLFSVPRLLRKSSFLIKSKKSYQTFNQWVFFSIISVLSMVAGFNFIVDPYDVFKTTEIQGLNQKKPQKEDNDRLFKTTDIIHFKPNTILLGSSRIRQGISPDYEILKKNVPNPIYNLGLNGSNAYELRQYLEHSLKNNPDIKNVVFGIDFFMFNGDLPLQEAFDKNRLKKTYIVPKDLLNTLLSLTALSDSKETFLQSWQSRDDLTSNENRNNGFSPSQNLEAKDQEWRFRTSINTYFKFNGQYALSPEHIQEFQKIVDICREKDINLIVFISPAHAIEWETITATGQWETFEQWKREMVKIYPIIDFSGYNIITTERFNPYMKNYTDSSHYTESIGNLIINRLFKQNLSQVPDDFGILITPDNIEDHLKMIREKRELWQKNHPQEVELVKEVKQKFDQEQSKSKIK